MDAWLIGLLGTVGTGGLTYLLQLGIRAYIDYKKKEHSKIDALSEGLQTMLRHNLQADAAKYFKQGYITPLQCKLWMEDYDRYHALGANGVMDVTKEEINKLEWRENNKEN